MQAFEQRYFMVGFRTPPEIPVAVLPTVELHQGDWLFLRLALGKGQGLNSSGLVRATAHRSPVGRYFC